MDLSIYVISENHYCVDLLTSIFSNQLTKVIFLTISFLSRYEVCVPVGLISHAIECFQIMSSYFRTNLQMKPLCFVIV